MAKNGKNELKELLKIEITEKAPCEKEIAFKLPANDVSAQYDIVLNDVRGAGNVPGFRPGKAPASLVKAKYDKTIRQELVTRIFQSAMERISSENMQIVSYSNPDTPPEVETGKDFEFKMVVNTAPEFEIPDFHKIELPVADIMISDEQVTKEIDVLRERFADFEKSESPAASGDLLKVSYTSALKDEPEFSEGEKYLVSAPESWVWLSDPEMIPGINKALIGAVPGGKVSFKAEFPEDFREKKLAGKNSEYEVEIKEIQRKKPLDSDEALCKRAGVDGIEKLREMIRARLKFEEEMRNTEMIKAKVIDSLLEMVGEFALPPSVLKDEIHNEFMAIAREKVKTEAEVETFKSEKDMHMKAAESGAAKKLRTFFLMRKIAEKENVKVESKDIESYMASASQYYKMNKKELKDRLQANGGIEEVKMSLLVSKVADHLAEKIKARIKNS